MQNFEVACFKTICEKFSGRGNLGTSKQEKIS